MSDELGREARRVASHTQHSTLNTQHLRSKTAFGYLPMRGFISRIQRFCVNDGPGIRSTVFAVGCPLECLWCANPELLRESGGMLYHAQRCAGCGACVALSGGAIRLGDDGCIIDRDSCSNLADCAAACHHGAFERVGVEISADELVSKLLRDKVFFDQSGGGVTFSGGEAALQAGFFLEATEILKSKSVHVALDTSGHVPWETLSQLASAVDLVLFDLKAIDSRLHERYTGADNRLIMENARRIAGMGKEMIIRMLIVPGVNDSDGEVGGRLNFALELGSAVIRVDILRYHRLGAGKYAGLGLRYPMEGTPPCSGAAASRIAQRAADMGLTVYVER